MSNAAGYRRRVAFFGGSFDPPHKGHLVVARAAQTALHLDTVLFAPVGAQPLKPLGSTASFDDRVAMTRLAIAGDPSFEISLADAPASDGSPNYTIDTLLSIRAESSPDDTLFCLMGADSFLSLRRWHRAAEVPFAAQFVVASRPGEQLDDLAATLPEGLTIEPLAQPRTSGIELLAFRLHDSKGNSVPFFVLAGLHIEISASEIRRQVSAAIGCSAGGHDLLPDAVCEYISSHNLYR